MDKYYGNVCELDIIFNFQKAYFILDELLLAGEMQESSKKNVLRCIGQQDSLEDMEVRPVVRLAFCSSPSLDSRLWSLMLFFLSTGRRRGCHQDHVGRDLAMTARPSFRLNAGAHVWRALSPSAYTPCDAYYKTLVFATTSRTILCAHR